MTHGQTQTAFFNLLYKAHLLPALIDLAPCQNPVVAVFNQPVKEWNIQTVVRIAGTVAIFNNCAAVRSVAAGFDILPIFQLQLFQNRYVFTCRYIRRAVGCQRAANIALKEFVNSINSAPLPVFKAFAAGDENFITSNTNQNAFFPCQQAGKFIFADQLSSSRIPTRATNDKNELGNFFYFDILEYLLEVKCFLIQHD